MSKMPALYICGPYRSATRDGVQMNITSALQVAKLASLKGWATLCPHANSGHLDVIAPELNDQFWLDATLELMRRCDAVVLCPGWQRSEGSKGEIAEAESLGMPIYRSEHDLPYADAFEEHEYLREAVSFGASSGFRTEKAEA